jgi:DGQHR domain-containing protein
MNGQKIPLLKVKQWLNSWEQSIWSPDEGLPKPPQNFYIASMPLKLLRNLAGVSRRQIEERKKVEKGAGYQRAHQASRSRSIARYIQFGYPLSNQTGLEPNEHSKLIHPGWLPMSILVNIIKPGETRRRSGKEVALESDEAVTISESNGFSFLEIPSSLDSTAAGSKKSALEPIEIIDGQHRLFAVDELTGEELDENYEVPVVFFDGLTESWQAYLFWVINVEPKKINTSLAFDLYPELRSQSWLESGEGIKVYQEHRAQELTEVLWRHPKSPWKSRIELHGNRIDGHVSNAAFIRSLMVSFVRRWGNEHKVGGLFGSIDKQGKEKVLPWKRSQQAAFLITCWTMVHEAVKNSKSPWVLDLQNCEKPENLDLLQEKNEFLKNTAFSGPNTLLATDQGCRAILLVFNAMSQIAYSEIGLEEWEIDAISDTPNDEDVSLALDELSRLKPINSYLYEIAKALTDTGMDWRTSSAPSLSREESKVQSAYRGSSGYTLLQQECYKHLIKSKDPLVAESAKAAITLLGIK